MYKSPPPTYHASPLFTLSPTQQLAEKVVVVGMEAFFEGWLQRQEELLQELLDARSRPEPDAHLRQLVNRALDHYKSYYKEKARLADRDVLLVYSPAWLTLHERTFLWVAGFRPSLVFRLLGAVVAPEQGEAAIEELEAEAAVEERRVTGEMARLQEAMAMPQVLGLVRRSGAARNGENRADEDPVVGPLLRSLRSLLQCADKLRVGVVKRLAEILRPAQMVDFLVAASDLHFRIRAWGLRTQPPPPGPAAS
uniref:Transcription factor HBP-1b(C1) n=1 Tax=Anthurium amnicola TaxID=1678845 RepID=A0A1D1Z4C1_9ARAE